MIHTNNTCTLINTKTKTTSTEQAVHVVDIVQQSVTRLQEILSKPNKSALLEELEAEVDTLIVVKKQLMCTSPSSKSGGVWNTSSPAINIKRCTNPQNKQLKTK